MVVCRAWNELRFILVDLHSATPVVEPKPNTRTYGRFCPAPPPAPLELIFFCCGARVWGKNRMPQFLVFFPILFS